MKTLRRSALVALVLAVLLSCAGKQAIVVDTTGLPPAQVALVEWKVKYAVALDWYDWQMKSLEANLAAMAPEDAKAFYKEAASAIGAVDASLQAFRAVVYSKSPDAAEQQKAYEAFLAAKTKLLGFIVRLID